MTDTTSDLSPQLTIESARRIVAGTLAAGRAANLNPLAVIVLDAGGHVTAFEREDGASPGRFAIANGKAAGAIAFGVPSRTLGEWSADRPSFIAAAGHLGVAVDRSVVIEDALSGVVAGRAGAFGAVIGVDRGAGRDALLAAGADIVVADLAALLPISGHPGRQGSR